MPTINQLVDQWRGWINRSKSFDGKELDELENHLLEEIDYLTEKDGLTEEEAFGKAVIEMGKRDNLDQEFTKVRGYVLPMSWIQKNSISIMVGLLLIISFFLADFNYSSKHKAYFYKNPRNIFVGLKDEPANFFILGTKEKPFKIKIKYWAKIQLDKALSDSYYYVIIDDQDQIWFDTDHNISNIQGEYLNINSLYEAGVDYKFNLGGSHYNIKMYNVEKSDKNIQQTFGNTFGPFRTKQIITIELEEKKRPIKSQKYAKEPIFTHYYISDIGWTQDEYNKKSIFFLMNQIENVEKPIHLWDVLFQYLQKL